MYKYCGDLVPLHANFKSLIISISLIIYILLISVHKLIVLTVHQHENMVNITMVNIIEYNLQNIHLNSM